MLDLLCTVNSRSADGLSYSERDRLRLCHRRCYVNDIVRYQRAERKEEIERKEEVERPIKSVPREEQTEKQTEEQTQKQTREQTQEQIHEQIQKQTQEQIQEQTEKQNEVVPNNRTLWEYCEMPRVQHFVARKLWDVGKKPWWFGKETCLALREDYSWPDSYSPNQFNQRKVLTMPSPAPSPLQSGAISGDVSQPQ